MFSAKFVVTVVAVVALVVTVATGQVFDVFAEPGTTEFGLEIDEVYLTDLENAPVAAQYMRPGNFSHSNLLHKVTL